LALTYSMYFHIWNHNKSHRSQRHKQKEKSS
jgi:hypothetical protein